MRVSCTVNGESRQADDVWEGESLLWVLRERLGLPGSKNACEQGECGSCSVYLDGVLVCACLVLAGQAEGSEIVTVEGLAPGDTLHPVQEAFVEAGAVQCGFCTPGLVVATHDLLARNPSPTDPEIREALAGNLCRCTGYEKVLAAVRLAAGRLVGGGAAGGRPGGGGWVGGRAGGGGWVEGRPGPGGPAAADPPRSGPVQGGHGSGVRTASGTSSGRALPSRSGARGTRGRDDGRPGTGEAGGAGEPEGTRKAPRSGEAGA
jgi:aerobic carbon-monoxide dehydrogenase small subunit